MSHQEHRGPSATTTTFADEPVRRRVHFVGTLPPALTPTVSAGMQWMLDRTGEDQLTTLPADRDQRWIIDWLEGLRDRGPFELVVDGDSRAYHHMPAYRVRPGDDLDPADVSPGRASQMWDALDARRTMGAATLPPHQVSMPAPLDLCLFAFGAPAAMTGMLTRGEVLRALRSAWKYLPVFTAAVVNEIEQIQNIARGRGDDVVVQLESPAVKVAYDRTPRAAWPLVTALLSSQLATVITATPFETSLVLHDTCRGDLGHLPIAGEHNLAAMVSFNNALAAKLKRAGRAMPPVHFTFCDGETGPSTDPVDYEPLEGLRPDIEVYAGLVDEQCPDASATALALAEQALGRPVAAVAAGCGLGRRTPDEAEANAALAWRLSGTTTRPRGSTRMWRMWSDRDPARSTAAHTAPLTWPPSDEDSPTTRTVTSRDDASSSPETRR